MAEVVVAATCDVETRQWGGKPGGPCLLPPGHRGHHSVAVFSCDGCGHVRRGVPAQSDSESGIALCFLCSLPPRRGDWW